MLAFFLLFLLFGLNLYFHKQIKNNDEAAQTNIRMVVTAAEFLVLQSILFFFATILLRFKRIEITINPAYGTPDQVLFQIKKFRCVSRCIFTSIVIFVTLIIFGFVILEFAQQWLSYAFWVPAVFSCIFYMFMLFIKIYFYKMGEKFLESMRKEGYKVSKCKSRSMFITIVVINSFGMLIFSFV